ncbi:hypothetical protein [Streptomyces gobitricini]|uniref:DUF3311 domain-containing protein n=1 Tax=Streptomyces gobitricini TaxID=68211 RepID=A0ABP5YQ52_9ACTN
MTTAALDLVLAPRAPWWGTIWPLPWYLTCASVLTWAVLRAREKTAQCPPDGDDDQNGWDQAA